MLREEEKMDFIFNVTVSAANWALLAGYLVVLGTFTSLQSSDQVEYALPISLNAAAGLLTTIINVCASQRGNWSVMAIVTTVATGVTLTISLALLCFYKFYLLEKIKRDDAVFTFVMPPSRSE
ncbi:hypothetical protein N7490_006720 [Penicillium lividum]|nr:hypothetical protein N7490_006720 [Penicillium lividum]